MRSHLKPVPSLYAKCALYFRAGTSFLLGGFDLLQRVGSGLVVPMFLWPMLLLGQQPITFQYFYDDLNQWRGCGSHWHRCESHSVGNILLQISGLPLLPAR